MSTTITIRLSQHGPFVSTLGHDFFRDPSSFPSFLEIVGNDYLRRMWEDGQKRMAEEKCGGIEYVLIPPDGITISKHELGRGITATVIASPEPNMTPDAYFVAMVVPPEGVHMKTFGGRTTGKARCFTLEATNGEYPFLCEWKRDGGHCSYAQIEQTTVEAFVEGLRRMLVD